MPNFQAKLKNEINLPEQPPREPLPKLADGTDVNVYYFRDKTATVTDVTAPGFFNFMRDTFRSGARMGVVHMVKCLLGEVADGLVEIDLHVTASPDTYSGPVLMAASEPKKYKTGEKLKAV